MPRPFVATALAIALATSSSSEAQERWTHICEGGPDPAGWALPDNDFEYTLVSSEGGCVWETPDGAKVTTDETDYATLMGHLDAATIWLEENGYRASRYYAQPNGGKHPILIVPPGSAVCDKRECEAPLGDGLQRRVLKNADGEDVLGYAVQSDQLGGATELALAGLMHATEAAYPGFDLRNVCQPDCWISLGIAIGFADWWLTTHGDKPALDDPGVRFSEPLVSQDFGSSYAIGSFWAQLDYGDGFAYTKRVITAVGEAAQEGQSTLAAVDAALDPENAGVRPDAERSAVRQALVGLANTAPWMRGWPLAKPDDELVVPVGEGPQIRAVTAHAPLSIVRVPVRIDREGDEAYGLTVRIEGAPESITVMTSAGLAPASVAAYVEKGFQYDFNVGQMACPPTGDCAFDVYLVNAHPQDATATTAEMIYSLEFEAGRVCAFPNGSTGVTYAATMADPDRPGRQADVVLLSLEYPPHHKGARTRVEGEYAMAIGDYTVTHDVEADLLCDEEGRFEIANLRVEGASELVGLGSVQAWGTPLVVPADAKVGDRLQSVIQDARFQQGGAATGQGGASLYDLEITDRTSREVEGAGRVTVWELKGVVSYDVQMDSSSLEAAADRDREVAEGLDEEIPQEAREALGAVGTEGRSAREALREVMGSFAVEREDQPITIYYSPLYGVVETVTGMGTERSTQRLVSVTRRRR